MGQKKRTEQLVLNIGIALTAGMFSIVPVAYGAPVSDGVKTAGVAIGQVAAATAGCVDTNITSTAQNNVIGWQDFSVAKGESVNFNDNHNYLNIVSGQNTSQIDGAINSQGGNIYLVNPNGVIIGKGASINVGTAGSFNVSTRYLDAATAKESVAAGKAISTVIQDASSTVASDIVNMGSIAAKSVVLEGNNIRFMDSGTADNTVNVTNDNISFKSSASGYVHIGNSAGAGVSGYKVNGTNNDSLTDAQKKNTYYQLVDSMSGITNAGGNYMLSKDITSASGYSGTFTGKFDGMGFTINGFTANNGGGLFQATQGALIENLGVTNINISDPQDNGAGGIIGTASSGTVLRNVYSTGLIQNGSTVGGLVGNANGVTIDHSYSSVTITSGEGAGIIGYVASGTNKISNSYFNGSAAYGFIGDIATYSNSNKLSAEVTNSYAISQSGPYFQPKTGLTIVNSLVKDTSHNKLQKYTTAGATPVEETYSDSIMNRQKYYSDLGWDISNTGGVKVDGNGAVTRPTWRIYEGKDTPILTSMTKGIKTVSYNYGYFKADGSLDTKATVRNAVSGQFGIGSNGRADMPAYNETSQPTGLVYNGETLKIVDKNNNALTATTANDASVFIKTEGKSTVAASDIKYNTSGQKNSTYEAISSTQGTQNTLAMVWSNQQGYDLVGGNISIAPRTVKAVTDYSNTTITKQYDGKADASEAFKNLFSGNSTTTTGILAVDKDAVTVAFSGSASFVDSNGNVDASVGKGKNIKFGSNSSINLAFANNSAGNAARNNYILNATGTNFTSGTILTGVGTITQKDLVIGFNSSFYSGGTAINKTYDGTTAAAAATDNTFTLTGIVTPEGSTNKDKVSIDITSAEANYIDGTGTATKNAGSHSVRYSGLKLTGDNAKNYRLLNANGDVLYSEAYNGVGADVNKETGGYLDGAGTIAKKNISLGGFSVNGAAQGAEKTYDNTEYYDGALGQKVYSDGVVHNADKTVWDDLTFTVTNDSNGHSGYFTENENSTNKVSNAGAGYGVGYHVTIGGSDADNYQINHADITNGSTAVVTGSGGKINKRVITLALGNTTTDIDKTYDGDELVKVTHNNQLTSDIALSDGLVKYANGSNQLIASDGTKLSIKGKYIGGKDVVKSNTYGIGADKGIEYTISVVDGTVSDKAKNYVFKTQDGEATQTITGATGAINPVHIKNIQFGDVSKTYDGSEAVKGEQTSDVISVAGITDGTNSVLVNGDTLGNIVDTTRIMGTYGSGNTDATFAKNAHVQRDNHNAVIAGTVKYTGKDANGAAASLKNSIISDNYVLDIDSEYGKGTINPLTINSMNELTLKHGTITKAYDGSASVAYKDAQGVNHTADEFVNDLYATVGNTKVNLSYTVGDANYGGANGADANVARDSSGNAAKKDVTYKLKVTENGDYAIAAGLKDSNGYVTKVFQTANNDGGIITPRKLKAQAAASGFTKTYDATNVVYAGTTPLAGNGVVTFIGYDNAADGLLTKDQSANNSSAVYANVDAGTGKAINYTAKIGTGSDAIANNYDIYVSNDNKNWTKGTLFTANNGTINKAGLYVTFNDVTKKYDGNAYVKDANNTSLVSPNYHNGIKSRGGTADTVYVSFASDSDSLFASPDVARDANGQVTSQNVTYKFTLAGARAKNYFIADANGKEVTTKDGAKTVINGRGTIEPKTLTDADVKLNFAAVNKVYDMTSGISYNHSTADYGDQAGSQDAADYIDQFTIGGVVLKNGQMDTKGTYYNAAGIYLNSTGNETSGVDADRAKFTITLTDKALLNFDLSSVSFFDATAKTLTKTTDAGTASITPKNVTVSFHAPEVTKVYNGKKDVVAGSTQANPDGTALAIGTNILNVSGIIHGDKAELDRGNVNARYADKNVAYDSTGKVTSMDVYYDAVLKGNNAANYKLVYGTKGSTLVNGKPSLTVTGKGTITPKEITADFDYDGNVAAAVYNKKAGDTTANKAYDAKDTVNSLSSKNIAGANGEVIKLDDASITGTYGKWTADANGAQTGIGAVGQTEKGNFTANGDVNWLGTGSTEDEKTGYKAVKYTGLQQALENATGAGFSSKNYTIADTVYFTEAAKKGKIRQLALTADKIHEKWTTPITKEYDGTDTVQDAKDHLSLYTDVTGSNIDIKYDLKSAVYDNNQVNVVSGHGVTYTLNDLEPQEFKNFKMDAAMLTSFQNKTYTNTGSITPRTIQLSLKKQYDSKIYDGTRDASTANINVANILDKDTGVILSIDGKYDDVNATIDPGEGRLDGRSITYTFTIGGAGKDNYQLSDASLTAKGDIIRRKVYVDFQAGNGTGIDKAYDGTKNVADIYKDASRFKLKANGENTGVLSAETGIVQLADTISAAYQSPHVKRTSQGQVTTQDVTYQNFSLQGAGSGNYYLATQELTGKGTIKPVAVGVSVKNGPVKEYDGTTAISGVYNTAANINIDKAKLIGNDTVNIRVAAAEYADKNAGSGTKGYTYQLNWDNGDYDLVAQPTTAGETMQTSGLTGTLSGTNGTITPRVIKLALKDSHDAKIYDGTTNAATDNVKVTRGILADDANKVGLSITGAYDSAKATVNPDAGFVNGRTITYSFTINGDAKGNYQLADNSLTADGDIIRRKVYADFAAGQGTGIDKVYDGTTNVTVPYTSAERFRLAADGQDTGVVATDRGKVQVGGSINGMYASAHVQRDAQGKATAQNVKYTGFDLAGEGKDNYYLMTNELQGTGTITPRAVGVSVKDGPVKEYDGTTAIAGKYGTAANIQVDSAGLIGNDKVAINVTDANYADKNAAEGTKHYTYNLGWDNGDYDLVAKPAEAGEKVQTAGLSGTLSGTNGTITPRVIKLALKDSHDAKIYDGTTNAATDNVKVTRGILADDANKVGLSITGAYDNAKATVNPDAGFVNGRTITYSFTINGDTKGNYQLADNSLTADGDIIRRKVYADFAAGQGTGIDKVYDGTTNVTVPYTSAERFRLAADGQDTGVVAADRGKVQVGGSINGMYASAHVQRDAQGKATAQNVKYTGFDLAGEGKDNYYLMTNELQGTGTITPRAVGVSVKDGPVKEYDGTTAIAGKYGTAANIQVDSAGLIGNDKVAINVTDANYADKNAAEGTKHYTYNFGWDNGDYDLVAKPAEAGEKVQTAGLSGTLSGTNGTITPRVLAVNSLANAEKEYDGTTAVKNAAANVGIHERIVRGDDIGLTASAEYDNANAGVSEDSDELIRHKVNYKLNLANSNYQLAENEVQGEGTIRRKGLEVVAEPTAINAGDAMPSFTGYVSGVLPADNGVADMFTFHPSAGVTTATPGEYAVYGWYKGNTSGNLGQNYSFSQAAGNDTAFTVNLTDPGREYHDTVNPNSSFIPDRTAYKQAALDPAAAGEFRSTGKAALEYRDKKGTVLGVTTIASGDVYENGNIAQSNKSAGGANSAENASGTGSETGSSGLEAMARVEAGGKNKLARIGITGDDVVNMENVDAGNVAQIEVDGDGSIVNLEIVPLTTESPEKDAQAEIQSMG